MLAGMKVLTWNVNSLRSRLGRLLAVLDRHEPDVVCLQELKGEEHVLPLAEIGAAGYVPVAFGQKRYNGVAILARPTPVEIRRGLDDGVDDPQARLISAKVSGVRIVSVYVPNGCDMGSEGYYYKLDWLQRLRAKLGREHGPDEPLLICGDTNVAFDDRDAAEPWKWESTGIACTDVRELFAGLLDWGLYDTFREAVPEAGHYSWWDYRAGSFQRDDGMRIDHILATRPLLDACSEVVIDRAERKGKKPSDHAPVIATFNI
jgi:exodeoxyribonuclease-3